LNFDRWLAAFPRRLFQPISISAQDVNAEEQTVDAIKKRGARNNALNHSGKKEN
jgi:hypothetical protein